MSDLKKYNSKRNFDKTKEPYGVKKKTGKKLTFVIQHHYARREHYDVRLEWKGVYVSFAVPKGPSFNPLDKRLAVKVEDHPLSYGSFEGVIPKGEYGGGVVMLWDKGTWEPLEDVKVDFEHGPIKFKLKGERLEGCWALVKFNGEDNWLLIKEKDKFVKSVDIAKFKTSIKTGRTKEEIEKGEDVLEEKEISSPDKVIYPKDKVTKGDIASYYRKVAKRMIPFLKDRLISTIRCPSGLTGEKFFMKHLNTDSKNLGLKKVKDKEGINKDYYYMKNVNGLLDEVQMNSYEFHIWGSLKSGIKKPNFIVFDLDPDEGLSLAKVRTGVKDLKSILDKLKLKSYLKTSGGKGYHVVVPLELSSFKEAEKISSDVAQLMVETWPKKYTVNIRKDARKGKIFIDYFRNKEGATSVAPYSLRLRDGAPVSMPIKWSDLDKIKPNEVTIKTIDKYLKRKDPWQEFFN